MTENRVPTDTPDDGGENRLDVLLARLADGTIEQYELDALMLFYFFYADDELNARLQKALGVTVDDQESPQQ